MRDAEIRCRNGGDGLLSLPVEHGFGCLPDARRSSSKAIAGSRLATRRPFVRSQPGKLMLMATALLVFSTVLLPMTPLGRLFELVALPHTVVAVLAGIVVTYVLVAEWVKRLFYRAAA